MTEEIFQQKLDEFADKILLLERKVEMLENGQKQSPVMTVSEVYHYFNGAYSLNEIRRGKHGFDKCRISEPNQKLRFSRIKIEKLKLEIFRPISEKAAEILAKGNMENMIDIQF